MDTNEINIGIKRYIILTYLIILIPSIIANAVGYEYRQTLTILTCISLALSTIIPYILYRKPIPVSISLISTVFLTYQIVLGKNLPWSVAVAGIVVEAILLLSLSISSFKRELLKAFPPFLRFGLIVSAGIYLMYVGFVETGFLTELNNYFFTIPDFLSPNTLISFAVLVIAAFLMDKRFYGAMLLSIIIGFIIFILITNTIIEIPTWSFDSSFLKLADINSLMNAQLFSVIITLFLIEAFHTEEIEMVHSLRKSDFKILTASTLNTFINSFLLLPSVVGSAETAKLKGGLLSVLITTSLFLITIFVANYISLIPYSISAALLIIYGAILFSLIKRVKIETIEEILTLAMLIGGTLAFKSPAHAFTFSLLFYIFMKIVKNEAKEVHPILYIILVLLLMDYFRVI